MAEQTVALAVEANRARVGDRVYLKDELLPEDLDDRTKSILLKRGVARYEVVEGEGSEGAPSPSATPSPAGSDPDPDPDPSDSEDEDEDKDEEPAEGGENTESQEEVIFPQRIGESSMYLLSNGDKVRGKAAAQYAENKLQDTSEDTHSDPAPEDA